MTNRLTERPGRSSHGGAAGRQPGALHCPGVGFDLPEPGVQTAAGQRARWHDPRPSRQHASRRPNVHGVSPPRDLAERLHADVPQRTGRITNLWIERPARRGGYLSATDADGDPLTFSVLGNPAGSSLVDGLFTWVPGTDQIGDRVLTFEVSDGRGGFDFETVAVTVPHAALVSVSPQSGIPGQEVSATVTGSWTHFLAGPGRPRCGSLRGVGRLMRARSRCPATLCWPLWCRCQAGGESRISRFLVVQLCYAGGCGRRHWL
jgi:hypothetical protein